MIRDYYDTDAVNCEAPRRGGKPSQYFIRCYYEYTEGEKEVRYYPDGSGYPGSPPELNIWKVTIWYGSIESECAIHLLEEVSPRFDLEELEETILKQYTDE